MPFGFGTGAVTTGAVSAGRGAAAGAGGRLACADRQNARLAKVMRSQ